MSMIAPELNNIFGPDSTTSIFTKTTPRHLLFEGIEFCRDPVGIAQIVCKLFLNSKIKKVYLSIH